MKIHYPVCAVSEDGSIEYVPITRNYLEQSLTLIGNIFFKHEHISKLIGLYKERKAITELLETLVMDGIDDGLSYVAIDRKTDKVVGCQVNTLAVKTGAEKSYYRKFKLQEHMAKVFINVCVELDESVDVFEMMDCKCYMEPMITAVLPEYRKKGLMKVLTNLTGQAMKLIQQGKNAQVNLDGEIVELSSEQPSPCHVVVYATSDVTTKVITGMGFTKVCNIEASKLESLKNVTMEEWNVEVLAMEF